MKLKKFPVLDMSEFETVCIDATQWEDGTYSIMLAFFKNFADEKKRARGFVMNTYMGGESLREVYHKIDAIFSLGLFNGTELSAHGTLYDQEGEKIDDICWHQFSDEIDDEDITDEIAHSASKRLH
jgi:hypothetical protein